MLTLSGNEKQQTNGTTALFHTTQNGDTITVTGVNSMGQTANLDVAVPVQTNLDVSSQGGPISINMVEATSMSLQTTTGNSVHLE